MSERVPAWAESDERYPEREAEWRAAIARAERAEAALHDLRTDMLRGPDDAPTAGLVTMDQIRAALRDYPDADFSAHRVRAEEAIAIDERRDSLAESRRRWIDAIAPILGDDGCSVDDVPSRIEAYRASVEAPLRAEIERITARHDRRLAVIDDVRVALASPDGEDIRVAARRVVAERDAYAALDCSVQHDEDRAALGVASLRAERAEVERDTLAAALAEVREAARVVTAHARYSEVTYASCVELDRALTALPADLAADAFRRARAEALEAAADAIERGSVLSQYGAHGWLRARAADERGGR